MLTSPSAIRTLVVAILVGSSFCVSRPLSGEAAESSSRVAAATPSDVPEVVRRDWYFRESLRAISDWERILAWWENHTDVPLRTPTLPVPATGVAVEWPNPIPAALLPAPDRNRLVRVRSVRNRTDVDFLLSGGDRSTRTVDAKETIVGYRHPGGGGRDRWNHEFRRRFDGLTAFRPVAAPFAVRVHRDWDWLPGESRPNVRVENVSQASIDLTARVTLLAIVREPGKEDAVRAVHDEKFSVSLRPGASQELPLPKLTAPGGTVLMVSYEVEGETWWLPLLAYVEDVAALLENVEKLAADSRHSRDGGDEGALMNRLAVVRRRLSASPAPHGLAWRELFEETSRVRDELLWRRIDFDSLLFIKRKPFISEQPFMDAHHCYNRPGGGIFRLSPVRPDGRAVSVVDSLGPGIYRDVCLHWEADRLLFAFGNGLDRIRETTGTAAIPDGPTDYDIFEAAIDGHGLKRLTSGRKNDCEPLYLPGGKVAFTSDRSEHYVMCGSDIHVANLFTMSADGTNVRQLSYNVFNEFTPALLPDGRILYSRWEYNERSVTSLHKLFAIHPDGTHPAPYYGNATIRPSVAMFGRPVPNSHKVMALFTAHHGQTHGPIGLVDVLKGGDGSAPIFLMTPGVPVCGERTEDSFAGWFSDPVPLDENTYLCSYSPTAVPWHENTWAIYIGDRRGNLALIYRDPEISLAEPVPVARRRVPAKLTPSDAATVESGEAELLLLDAARGLPGVPRKAIKSIRILEDLPRKSVPHGGVISMSATPVYTAKRVIGTAPVEADGSARFVVPANRNLYFQLLDSRGREIQRMRSVVALKPGERRTCAGCHEPRESAPPNLPTLASRRPASRPSPPPWQTRPLSFRRDVQPVLTAKCVRCHSSDRRANRVILTDDLTDQFTVGYEELVPYLNVANAKRWDHPDDVESRPPYTYGSNASRLVTLLDAGHHGAELSDDEWLRLTTWIDANGVYYDRYESVYPDRRIFTGEPRSALEGVHERRCRSCHDEGKHRPAGGLDARWLSLNVADASRSRMLRAPLSRAAGGEERCPGPVFESVDDSDYRMLLSTLETLSKRLSVRPREDLPLASDAEQRSGASLGDERARSEGRGAGSPAADPSNPRETRRQRH